MAGIAAVITPMAFRWNDKKERPAIGSRDIQIIAILVMATVTWSVMSMYLMQLVIRYEISDAGFVNQVNNARPLEFLGFCGFALMVAVLEEVIFRGGLLGAL